MIDPAARTSGHSILMVEDAQEDFEALTRALQKAGIRTPIYRFSHGESALDYLRGRGRYLKPGSAARPSLVLLDLNLPSADGREVLAAIKTDPDLKAIPVVVLTTSESPGDVEFCYRSGANSYILKPSEPSRVVELIRRLTDYWFDLVQLPAFA